MSSSIPQALYAHPDPLLSRLRLNDSTGQFMAKPASSSSELRDVQVVGLLFGAVVERERAPNSREFYKSIAELSRRNPHRFKCIYVSIDPSEELMKESIRNKGWLSCVWNDGSNAGNNAAALAQIANDEDFIMDPLEELPDEKLEFASSEPLPTSSDKNLYKRPYSRVGLGQKFDILTTPTLVVYHVPSRKIITKRATKNEIRSDHADETIAAWFQGQQSPHIETFGIKEILMSMKWTAALGLIYLLYWLMLTYGATKFSLSPLLQSLFVPEELRDNDAKIGF